MYKSASKHLQLLSKEKDHAAHSKDPSIKSSVLATLVIGRLLIVNIALMKKDKILVTTSNIKGELDYAGARSLLRANDKVIVRLDAKTIGVDGNIYLKTTFVGRIKAKKAHKLRNSESMTVEEIYNLLLNSSCMIKQSQIKLSESYGI